MYIVEVNCEWELGVPSLFEDKQLAEDVWREAFQEFEDDLSMTYEDAVEEGLISFEIVKIVTRD